VQQALLVAGIANLVLVEHSDDLLLADLDRFIIRLPMTNLNSDPRHSQGQANSIAAVHVIPWGGRAGSEYPL
jgi:hypothetical protein